MPESSKSVVVVNASPLIALGTCGRIDLLRSLYDRVVIPEEVQTELAVGGETALPAGLMEANLKWIEVLRLNSPLSIAMTARLDDGEASVIALALELGATRIVMDERKGRKLAENLGLDVIGCVFRGIVSNIFGDRVSKDFDTVSKVFVFSVSRFQLFPALPRF